MKNVITILFTLFMSIGLIAFLGCDDDSGTEPGGGSLVGHWEATYETIMTTQGNIGVDPDSPMFRHLDITVKEDSTFTYEYWVGTDKDAEEAGYENSSGTWEVDGSNFSMTFEGDAEIDHLEGTYKFSGNKLIINTQLDVLLPGMEEPAPMDVELQLTPVE